jgi:hypothetical protein
MVLALIADETTVTQAFDIGAVTTGPMTVPFLIALGVGIASVLGNQSRMRASFGLMAIGSIGPVLSCSCGACYGVRRERRSRGTSWEAPSRSSRRRFRCSR